MNYIEKIVKLKSLIIDKEERLKKLVVYHQEIIDKKLNIDLFEIDQEISSLTDDLKKLKGDDA
jgi:hypothetical protein